MIRKADISDADACAAIHNAWIDLTRWVPRVHTAEDVVHHYRDRVFEERQIWVKGQPVEGFLALYPEAGVVTSLCCAPTGAGIGKSLLDRAKVARASLELWTFTANQGARRFYAREGFSEVQRTDGENEEQLPGVLLRWEATQ